MALCREKREKDPAPKAGHADFPTSVWTSHFKLSQGSSHKTEMKTLTLKFIMSFSNNIRAWHKVDASNSLLQEI